MTNPEAAQQLAYKLTKHCEPSSQGIAEAVLALLDRLDLERGRREDELRKQIATMNARIALDAKSYERDQYLIGQLREQLSNTRTGLLAELNEKSIELTSLRAELECQKRVAAENADAARVACLNWDRVKAALSASDQREKGLREAARLTLGACPMCRANQPCSSPGCQPSLIVLGKSGRYATAKVKAALSLPAAPEETNG